MTALLTWLTIGVALAIVLVLVYYLVGIIVALTRASNDLAKLAGGLVAIDKSTAPLDGHVQAINGGLSTLLRGLLGLNADLQTIVGVARRE
jgi:hypothetical protein